MVIAVDLHVPHPTSLTACDQDRKNRRPSWLQIVCEYDLGRRKRIIIATKKKKKKPEKKGNAKYGLWEMSQSGK